MHFRAVALRSGDAHAAAVADPPLDAVDLRPPEDDAATDVFHFGQLRVGDVKAELARAGVPVRF